MQLSVLESREEETVLAPGGLLKTLRNETLCGTKNISLPGQFNLSSFSGREERLLWVSHLTDQGTGLCDVLIIKIANSEQSEAANVCFSQDLFPVIKEKKKKIKKRSQEESQVQSRAVLEPWSLESCQASWQEIRQACDGNLPVFHRKFIQTETLLRNILLMTNWHSLTKTCAVGNLPASASYGINIPSIIIIIKKKLGVS